MAEEPKADIRSVNRIVCIFPPSFDRAESRRQYRLHPELGRPVPFIQCPFVETMAEARNLADGAVVMRGDWGGQIYLTCPIDQVRCSEASLQSLLASIDRLQQNVPEGQAVVCASVPQGAHLLGGDGGGEMHTSLWVHPFLEEIGLCENIAAVLAGASEKLFVPPVGVLEIAAEDGDIRAQYLLAKLFFLDQKIVKALFWYERLAEAGDKRAITFLVTSKAFDNDTRKKWLQSVAAHRRSDSCFRGLSLRLARAYEEGTHLPADREKAIECYIEHYKISHSRSSARHLIRLYLDRCVDDDLRTEALTWLLLGLSAFPFQRPYLVDPKNLGYLKTADAEEYLSMLKKLERELPEPALTQAEDAAKKYLLEDGD